MSCVSPLTIKQKGQEFKVSCGQCMQCRIRKQQELIFIAKKELQNVYNNGQGASFITLTYNNANIPINKNGNVTLKKKDLQNFIKRIRRNQEYHKDLQKWKYIACGEYGDQFKRPHYHIVIIGLSQEFAKLYTKKEWKFGIAQIGTLTAGGLRYVLKYCTKSKPTTYIKALYNTIGNEPPFLIHSQNIGKKWIDENIKEIDNQEFTYTVNGKKIIYPKYIREYTKQRLGIDGHAYINKYTTENILNKLDKSKNIQNQIIEQNQIKEENILIKQRIQGKACGTIGQIKNSWEQKKASFETQNLLNEINK